MKKHTIKSILIIFSIIHFQLTFGQVKDAFTQKSLPDVNIETLEGESVNIKSFGENGKITIINFWATWCGPCKLELNNIADIYDEWQEDYNVELLAVSIDDSRNKAKVKSFVNGQGWDYVVLLDQNQDLKRAFNFQMPPYTVLTDQNGKIVSVHSGYKSGDEFILEDKIKALSRK